MRLAQHDRREAKGLRSQRLNRAVTCLLRKEREEVEAGAGESAPRGPMKRNSTGGEASGPKRACGGFLGQACKSAPLDQDMCQPAVLDTSRTQPQSSGDTQKLPGQPPRSTSSSSDEEPEQMEQSLVTARSVFGAQRRGRGRGARGRKKARV